MERGRIEWRVRLWRPATAFFERYGSIHMAGLIPYKRGALMRLYHRVRKAEHISL